MVVLEYSIMPSTYINEKNKEIENMSWINAINEMSGSTKTTKFTDTDLVIDMSEYYEEWTPHSSVSMNREKLYDYFCSIVTCIDKEEIRKHFEDQFNPVFDIDRIILNIAKSNIESFRECTGIYITNKKWTDKILFSIKVYNKSNLSDIADFQDDISESFTHINHDVILKKEGNTYFIKNNKKRLSGDAFLSYDTVEDFNNLSVYPRGLAYNTPIFLKDATLLEKVCCSQENSVISVEGKVCIAYKGAPIQLLRDCKTLTINGSGELLIRTKEGQQPCIGCSTYTGMSYGRWSPGIQPNCEKIIIDGAKVICESLVDNFTIGQYGTNYCPVIECINGGSIECPEVKGERYIEYQAKAPSGSTKISEHMKYSIRS